MSRALNLLVAYICLPSVATHGTAITLWALTGLERVVVIPAVLVGLLCLWNAKTIANWLAE